MSEVSIKCNPKLAAAVNEASAIKANGVHYTPPDLAGFLATVTADDSNLEHNEIRVLDPACGDGGLLAAFAAAVPLKTRRRLVLLGFETDADALIAAEEKLAVLDVKSVVLRNGDFLETLTTDSPSQRSFFDEPPAEERFQEVHVVIANPPYVRTQVLGATKAQALAKKFGLTGRVDLYHAFVMAMASVLRPGGTLGLLTSNRFLTIKSGVGIRRLLNSAFTIRHLYDLGDTKLFGAAVLPAIVVASKGECQKAASNCFTRIYEARTDSDSAGFVKRASVFASLLEPASAELVETPAGRYRIEHGTLLSSGKDEVWSLSTPDYDQWLATIRANQAGTFESVARIRVGIKTTADEVFIRDDWMDFTAASRPEKDVLKPLIRHFDATKWVWTGRVTQHVLYPHTNSQGKRRPVSLSNFPRAASYLHEHQIVS